MSQLKKKYLDYCKKLYSFTTDNNIKLFETFKHYKEIEAFENSVVKDGMSEKEVFAAKRELFNKMHYFQTPKRSELSDEQKVILDNAKSYFKDWGAPAVITVLKEAYFEEKSK